jgi:calcium-translocating P-type ATPase
MYRPEGTDHLSVEVVPWHALPEDDCLARLQSSPSGLSADTIARLKLLFGPNILPRRPPPSLATLFLRQFRSPLIYLLLGATIISLAIGDRTDALFILGVLLINAAIGATQERRAGASAEALRSLIRQTARVRRDGALAEIDAGELVPGDVVELETGMRVPADIRLLEALALSADESLLSGESLPVGKSSVATVPAEAGLGDRPTMLHAGTMITEGRGAGVVVETGPCTALGRVAASLDGAIDAPPPLMLRLHQLSRQIAVSAIGIIAVLGLVLALQGTALDEIFLLAVALAVSAIPEGLPVAVTVALSTATRRMARRHVIIRALPAVEGLGACTLIASDKTGTLTLNQLSVEKLVLASGRTAERADWLACQSNPEISLLVRAVALCNEASRSPDGTLVGDSVDVALLRFADEAGVCGEGERIGLHPYEPANRFASVMVRKDDGRIIVYAKGAVETIAAMCAEADPALIAEAESLACAGYRVLAIAQYVAVSDAVPDLAHPSDLELLGCVALLDPLRPEAREAIARCAEAGIKVRMVTGDHPSTALTIARQLGLAAGPLQVATGCEIAALVDRPEELTTRLRNTHVFARVEPAQKLLIVETLSASGEIVAVTGDGVNDAPALQTAHIGVAMGRSGTDVARSAADLILTDDNFASIVAGIEEGRITYANIRKIVIFLLATGIAEIGMFLGALLLSLPLPLTPVQLLWLNIVTNGSQDVMLGFGRGEGDELRRPPRPPREALVDGRALALMVPPALTMTGLALLLLDWSLDRGMSLAGAQNIVLLLTVLFQNAFVLCLRSERRSLLRQPLRDNPWLLLGIGIALTLHIMAMQFEPLRLVLGTSPPDRAALLACLAGMLAILIVTEATKFALARLIHADKVLQV